MPRPQQGGAGLYYSLFAKFHEHVQKLRKEQSFHINNKGRLQSPISVPKASMWEGNAKPFAPNYTHAIHPDPTPSVDLLLSSGCVRDMKTNDYRLKKAYDLAEK